MACYNGEVGPKFPSGRWEEFCKDKADSAARLFAQEFLQFVTDNPVYDASGASATFSKRFVEYFLETFDNEVHKNGLIDFGEPESPTDVFGPDDWGSSIHLTQNFKNNDKKISREEPGSRFAKKLKDVKDFFKRSVGEEPSSTRQTVDQKKPEAEEKDKLVSKLTSAVKREAVMNYLMNLDSGLNTEDFFWQKCRIVLLKAPGGFMLEFYTPPKVSASSFKLRVETCPR